MDYYHKYLKYKHKYLELKGGGGGFFDVDTFELRAQPESFVILYNEALNKNIIIMGESHLLLQYKYTYEGDSELKIEKLRENGYFKYLGLISKKINMAKNIEGDPFKKVLFLIEKDIDKLLLGGKREFDPEIFEKYNMTMTEYDILYADYLINGIIKRYPGHKNLGFDLRKMMGIKILTPNLLLNELTSDINFKKTQENIDSALSNIKKYVIDDLPINSLDIDPILDDGFFVRNPLRKAHPEPKKLSEIFIKTTEEYGYLKTLIQEEFEKIRVSPKYLVDSKFNYMDQGDRANEAYRIYETIGNYVLRLVDLYGLEYLAEMPNNSTTVYVCGYLHAYYLMNILCIKYGYKLKESNYLMERGISRYPYLLKIDYKEFNDIMHLTKQQFDSSLPENKKIFYKNLFRCDTFYKSYEDSLILNKGTFGFFQKFCLPKLFTMDATRHTYEEICF